MRMRTHSLLLVLASLVACSSDPETANTANATSGGAGGVASAGGGSAGTATGGTGGAPGGAAGSSSAGSAGLPTAGTGAAGAAGANSAGAAGAAGAGGSAGAVNLGMGTQMDPGSEGDGTYDQPPPYDFPPESLSHLDGAPQGSVTGPFLHVQTGEYSNWDQWTFTWYLYVPAQYQPGHAAALMVFNDGYLYNSVPGITEDSPFNAPTVFDNLIHEGSMPVTIGVFIWPGTNDGHKVGGGDGGRSRQYDTPNDQYGKFLLEEFLPANVLNDYDIVTDPDGWGIAGHSSGGIASIIAGWYYPDNFRKILTASPSFPNTGGVFPGIFEDEPAKPLRIYHLAGSNDLGGFKGANDDAAMIFEQLGYHYRYRPGEDQHYPPRAAIADFPDALRWLWRGYSAAP